VGGSVLPIFTLILWVVMYDNGTVVDGSKAEPWIINVMAIIFFFCIIVYIVSRLTLIGLTFYCFKSMPISVYEKVDWTGYLLHFS